jgi:hypothetical protein
MTWPIGASDTSSRWPRVDVQVAAHLVQLGEQPLRLADGQASDLDQQVLLVLARALDHHDIAAAAIGDQQQRQAQAPERRSRPVREVGQRGRGQLQRRQPVARDQLLQGQAPVVRRHCDTADLDGPPGAR